jgi:hypothetical protein
VPAFQNVDNAKGYDAAVALTKKRAVKFDGTDTFAVTPVTAATDVWAGVAMFSVSAAEILKGKGASVLVEGIAIMEAHEAISEGDIIAAFTDGTAQIAGSGDRACGVARSSCGSAGDEVAVQLDLPGSLVV